MYTKHLYMLDSIDTYEKSSERHEKDKQQMVGRGYLLYLEGVHRGLQLQW